MRLLTEIKFELIGILGKFLIDLLFCMTRIEYVGFEHVKPIVDSRKFVFAVWHSRLLLPSYIYRGQNGTALVSRSKDGEIAARILKWQGHEAIRGSASKRGLKALLQMIRNLKEKGKPGLVVPDGPTGPRFKAKAGVITLSKETGCPIIPITYSGKKIKVFNSWDRFILPYPFTPCRIVFGKPVYVSKEADKDEEKRCLEQLETELSKITTEADHYFGHQIT